MKTLFTFALFFNGFTIFAQGFVKVEIDSFIQSYAQIDSSIFSCSAQDSINALTLVNNCCCKHQISPEGLKVIQSAYKMTNVDKQKVRGTCWDFINIVYNKAGFNSKQRAYIFKSKESGPYADIDMIQPGDWLYHINYSYHNVGHSAIFLCWKDYDKKIAITVSHYGQNRLSTGVYGEFDLKGVYYITRPQ